MGNWKQEPQSLLPTAEPTRDDVLFFAGFYDGEGSACGTIRKAIVVQVPQKDPELLYRARSLWGGSVRSPKGRDVSVWVMSGDRARRFLIAIYPYLSLRRKDQIERAGGLVLSGKKSADVGGITAERRAARAEMTDAERHHESVHQYYLQNKEKMRESSLRWTRENREKVSARQRERRRRLKEKPLSAQNQIESERRPLIN
jgi:hypothetical protein